MNSAWHLHCSKRIDYSSLNLVTLLNSKQTFFSTSFFNFEPKHPNRVASAWLWIYFIVTSGLAAALAACWYFWSTHAQKKAATFQQALTNHEDEETGFHDMSAAQTRAQRSSENLREESSNDSREQTTAGAEANNEKAERQHHDPLYEAGDDCIQPNNVAHNLLADSAVVEARLEQDG